MKLLNPFKITNDLRAYEALHSLEMEATMQYYFLFHWNKRDYVNFSHVENDATLHTSPNDNHATHHN